MQIQTLYQSFQRYRTLTTDVISSLPIVILMPHSACNCRCVMCDIWKDNQNLRQLTEEDVRGLLVTLKKFGTRQVVMSGGEALLNPKFFKLCEIFQTHNIKISVLSTGLALKKNAEQILRWVDDVIVSLDGNEDLHNRIRNIPEAYQKLKEGVQSIKAIDPRFRITGRSVIHKLNFRHWPSIIDAAVEIGLDQISFLPADVSSHGFNREILWSESRQHEILLEEAELPELNLAVENVIRNYQRELDSHFIAESPEKLRRIYTYYAAFYQHNPFPYKKCNAPWVSTVIEADGTVRPCFFHAPIGNIKQNSLEKILNSVESIRFRKQLDIETDSTCVKCVCYLNLRPGANI
jgi:MoaA/NifB/PqqE/SkfB family radical SAM enzyme